MAVKLIGMPDPEPANEAAKTGGGGGGTSQPTTPGGGGRSHGGNKSPAGGGVAAAAKDSEGGGEGGGGGGADGLTDISPSEALSRRRELARGAMELAVLTTTSHPCLVQVRACGRAGVRDFRAWVRGWGLGRWACAPVRAGCAGSYGLGCTVVRTTALTLLARGSAHRDTARPWCVCICA